MGLSALEKASSSSVQGYEGGPSPRTSQAFLSFLAHSHPVREESPAGYGIVPDLRDQVVSLLEQSRDDPARGVAERLGHVR